MSDYDELKRLAKAVAGTCDHSLNTSDWVSYRCKASPSEILGLISRLEEQQETIQRLPALIRYLSDTGRYFGR